MQVNLFHQIYLHPDKEQEMDQMDIKQEILGQET